MNLIQQIKYEYRWLRARFGKPICPMCGSSNIKECGWEEYNHRHFCNDCGEMNWI